MLKSKREEATRWYEIFTRLYINLLYEIIEVKKPLFFSVGVVIYREPYDYWHSLIDYTLVMFLWPLEEDSTLASILFGIA